jgi:hypothetical protein
MSCFVSALGSLALGCGAATGVFDGVGAADDSGATFGDVGGNSPPDATSVRSVGDGAMFDEIASEPSDATPDALGSKPETSFQETGMDAGVTTKLDSGSLESFAFIVNGVKQTPLACPSEAWEYAPVNPTSSVVIENMGPVPIAYTARPLWTYGGGYIPGVETGDGMEIVGVLAPGERVNTTSVYNGGAIALLGSAEPFSTPGVRTITDEGTIPWPVGVPGSGGATVMQVAEIQVSKGCAEPYQDW